MSTETVQEHKPVEVGDVFYSSWGYDQTNIDYYKVVGLTKSGKSAKIVQIGSTVVEAHGPGGNRVVANPEAVLCDQCGRLKDHEWHSPEGYWRYGEHHEGHEFKAEGVTKRIQAGWRGEPSIKVRDFGVWAHPYHGGALYETDSQFGH